MHGDRRIRESTLLTTAFVGGAIGAKLGQRRFRHKTRKQPFATILNVALGLNLLAVPILLWPTSRTALLEFLEQAAMRAGI